jgi:hypothetical protein
MDNHNLSIWFNKLPSSTIENLLGPSSITLGEGLNGIVSIIANPAIKLGIWSKKNLQDYEENLYSKTAKIPKENRDSSKQGLALAALEDSLYRFTEKSLSEYYINLIAGILDNRKNNSVHPSFSQILKEMSSDDALLFKKIFTITSRAFYSFLPLVNVQRQFLPNGGYSIIFKDTIVIHDESGYSVEKNSTSLSSLERLGLIRISRNLPLNGQIKLVSKERDKNNSSRFLPFGTFENCYNFIFQTPEVKKSYKIPNVQFGKIELMRGRIEITDLAKNLGKIIIPDAF